MRAECECGWTPDALGENAIWEEVERHTNIGREHRVTVRPRIKGAN